MRKILLILIIFTNSCMHKTENGSLEKVNNKINSLNLKNNPISIAINCPKKFKENVVYLNYGSTKKEQEIMPNENSIYEIGSLTKLYLAALTIQQVEKGNISLEESIAKYLPNIPSDWQDIKIKNLLNMTSGIPSHFGSANLYSVENFHSYMLNPYQYFDKNLIIQKILTQKALFKSGIAWDYSNINYLLIGIILEKITGKKLDTLFKENISEKLHLKNTYFVNHFIRDEIPNSKINTLVEGYPSLENYLAKKNANTFSVSAAWGSGNVISSTKDVHIFITSFFNKDGKLFNQKNTYELFKNYFFEIASYNLSNYFNSNKYSLGVFAKTNEVTGLTDYLHTGGIPGYNSLFSITPSENVSYCLLTGSLNLDEFTNLVKGINDFINHECY
ncbi:serine hydrolase [Pigmentibacter sp. JX0631]|uniref:serine hydrolase domain-containing protein n=1 Tax=Pigmentibacter sp. JX0631 TaxID=2976982 RepID=UPI0024693E49|nr:serine hydrolase domain-containing protein [Pigmentibacter sp. JX0631]WGL61507.1 serine hydrolase [Pigmentibacter sp. JX0631]